MQSLNKSFLQILELSRDIIYMVGLEPELKMLYINPAITERLGISVEENYKYPHRAMEAAHVDELEIFRKKVSGELDYSKPIEVRYRHVNGDYIWFEESVIPIYDKEKKLIALVGFCRDIQERKMREEQLNGLIFADSLTGIKNRTFFEQEIAKLELKTDTSLGMIMCDLDGLKYVNDTYGHRAGDTLLRDFGEILDRCTDRDIAAARIGGDEFVLLIKGKSEEIMENLCLELGEEIGQYNSRNKKIPIYVSIGMGYSKTSVGMTQQVFNTADSRMYKNKAENKKNATSLY